MSPEELREKVARAIYNAWREQDGVQRVTFAWAGLGSPAREPYFRDADAALSVVREAMREPEDTFAMKDAIHDALSNGEGELRERDMLKVHQAWLAASPLREPGE